MAKLFSYFISTAGWPNGKALDYESRDCRFDPCVGQFFLSFLLSFERRSIFRDVFCHRTDEDMVAKPSAPDSHQATLSLSLTPLGALSSPSPS
ncbi:hypothetical protein N7466_006463 [Penicillium verhagenii]|uniref:uncharacterized protein n=1 Tax=Penicillium verhagenii TaxID=1562060 RepID=UPI0025457CBC|nr:uncharacterized protein N7466_006463 [Penicillium verhagenii]KAJ5930970.1 hypothetical protein N7466_006463 [Penicillium verhagenii]